MMSMIAGPDALAVEAGARVLATDGNAVDAAVTCAFLQGVVNPTNTGLGGYVVLTMHRAQDTHGRATCLDAPGTAGSRVDPAMWADRYMQPDPSGWGYLLRDKINEFGYTSICTPGTVRGLATILARWGTISLADAVEPAARVAEIGFPVDERVAAHWNTPFQLSSGTTILDYVRANPEASRLYLKADGTTHRTGETIRNAGYAATLRRIGERGADEFYAGDLGSQIASDLAANGSFVTASDLQSYRVRDVEPVVGTYRDHTVATSPSPHGGPTLVAILNILEGWDLTSLGHNSAEYVLRFGLAMKAAFADRNLYLGDPIVVDDRVGWMTSSERSKYWRQRIDKGDLIEDVVLPEASGTAHVSVVDAARNHVALTHSLGASSGVITPGLGFMYNNSMANFHPLPGHPNSMAPGKSRTTGMAPTILYRNGAPTLVLGASGATRIITALAQVIVNVVDFGMSPQEAIFAPRFDSQGGPIRCHLRIPEFVCEAVRRRHPIERVAVAHGGFGLVHAIGIDPGTGRLTGGADAGSAGMALEAPHLSLMESGPAAPPSSAGPPAA